MKRDPVVAIDIHGLKCDAPGCGWADPSVSLESYPDYVNAACPECGANVLTPADFRAVLRILQVTNWVNRWLWWLPKSGKPRSYSANLDGRGKPDWKPLP